MALREIITLPDPRLLEVSQPVEQFDEELEELVQDLNDTLDHHGGLGLSAPQFGDLSRVLIVDVADDGFGRCTYINPEIIAARIPGLIEESCMSIPGVVGNVFRKTHVQVRAQNVDGSFFESEVTGMHAVCLQHEIDHLDGKLFTDRLWWFRRLQLRRRWAREERRAQAA